MKIFVNREILKFFSFLFDNKNPPNGITILISKMAINEIFINIFYYLSVNYFYLSVKYDLNGLPLPS